MLIFDQLHKADRHLRVLSWFTAMGLLVLLTGLWWVQVVRSRHYVEDQRNQSYRTVRVPAPRGKILDRNGMVLAENRPSYNVSLYLEDRGWRETVQQQYRILETAARQSAMTPRVPSALERFLAWFGYKPSLTQSRRLSAAEKSQLGRAARYSVTSNIVWQLGVALGQPLAVDEAKFHKHYEQRLALPMPILPNLDPVQVARLQESALTLPGVEMDIQPTRYYPQRTLAAHVLGYLTHFEDSAEDELSFYNYRLPDYRGLDGIEASFDEELRGRAGAKAVLVNNLGYRQSETVLSPVEPGRNVMLTIDADIQREAEKALLDAPVRKPARGAAIVLDVRTGEILALASAPAHDPNAWIPRLPQDIWNSYTNDDIAPLRNRAVYGFYAPGSTFKTIVALAGLEAGTLNPQTPVRVEPNPGDEAHGIYYVGRQPFRDTASPGVYDFRRAFKKSSNSYFIEHGLRAGPNAIFRMTEHLHFGERTGIPLAQDSRGILPTPEWVRRNRPGQPWRDGDTANLSIGQGELAVTPLQLAVATAAVANGGAVLWPQLIVDVHAHDELIDPANRPVVHARIRDRLPISKRTLDVVAEAMLADTEDEDGTGREANVRYSMFRVCGKTGTAQLKRGQKVYDHITWFASYAPYENPRYAVIIMIQSGSSGGGTCAPLGAKIYRALHYREQKLPASRRDSFVRN
jgi:penicillin-binding protein 2